jgi:hypothetical protein
MSDRTSPADSAHSDWFWSIIDRIRANPDATGKVFRTMTAEQLEEFYHIYRAVNVELYPEYEDEERGWYKEDISCASDWVVNQGKAFYHAVYHDLSLFPDPRGIPYCALSSWAADEYYNRFGREFNH